MFLVCKWNTTDVKCSKFISTETYTFTLASEVSLRWMYICFAFRIITIVPTCYVKNIIYLILITILWIINIWYNISVFKERLFSFIIVVRHKMILYIWCQSFNDPLLDENLFLFEGTSLKLPQSRTYWTRWETHSSVFTQTTTTVKHSRFNTMVFFTNYRQCYKSKLVNIRKCHKKR